MSVIAMLVPWSTIVHLLKGLKHETVALLLLMSVVYYLAKTLRFWIMLSQLGVKKPFLLVAMSYISAQPVSLLPAGELYRSALLKKYADVPVHKSSPTVVMQGLIEAIVLLTAALIGAISLGKNQILVLAAAVILILLLIAIKRGWLAAAGRSLNKLPFVHLSSQKLDRFFGDNKIFLTWQNLPTLLLMTIFPIAAGIMIVYLAAGSVGSHLSLMQSTIAYCLPVVLSGLSFLPGGLGASEGGTIGLLHLMGMGVPEAVAVTLIVRVFTLGAGLLFGVIGIIVANIWEAKQ